MKVRYIFLTTVFTLFTYTLVMACDDIKKQMKALAGTWELLKTDCCGRLNKTTIAEPGEKVITFFADGKMEMTSDGEKVQSSWRMYRDTNFDKEATLLDLGKQNRPAMYNIQGDTLIISWGYMDLQTEYYLRKK